MERVTGTHFHKQLILITYCRQLCLSKEWPGSWGRVYRPGKTRGRGLNLYSYATVVKVFWVSWVKDVWVQLIVGGAAMSCK